MSDISIVTAFYDIGRSDWSPDKGFPSYLHRTTDTYFERFSYLTQLSNDITVFTTADLVDRVKSVSNGKKNLTVIEFDPFKQFIDANNLIKRIQQSEDYKSKIHKSLHINPEYWCSEYVLVNILKPYFVNKAIDMKLVQHDTVAWVDFGYCRTVDKIPSSKRWNYNFDPTKIHLFALKYYDNMPIQQIIGTNNVYIIGAKSVASKKMWPKMLNYMQNSFDILAKNNLMDDDQTLWLMSYLSNSDSFELHKIPDHQQGHDPFVLFSNFNKVK